MSDGGDGNAKTETDEVPKQSQLWADMSDEDEDDYISYRGTDDHSSVTGSGGNLSGQVRSGNLGMNRATAIKTGRMDNRGISGGIGNRGGSGQRQTGGQRSYGRGQQPVLERRGSRTFNSGGTPSSLFVQHGPSMGTIQRRQPGLGHHSRSANATSRNQSSAVSHASSPAGRNMHKMSRPAIEIPQSDPGAPYRLHVSPLPLHVSQEQLQEAFNPIKLKQVDLPTASKNDRFGQAFVEVFSYKDMVLALTDLQNRTVGDKSFSVRVQKRKMGDNLPFKIARSVGQLPDKPTDRDSERSAAPPRPEGSHKGHKKALLCMLASDNDTTRDTKIFGTGKPREEKLTPPPVLGTLEDTPHQPNKAVDSKSEQQTLPPHPHTEPPALQPETVLQRANSPSKSNVTPTGSGQFEDNIGLSRGNGGDVSQTSVQPTPCPLGDPPPDAEERPPTRQRQQFQDIHPAPHMTSMPLSEAPTAVPPRHESRATAVAYPPHPEIMMGYGMMPKSYFPPTQSMIEMTNPGFRYPHHDQQYAGVMPPHQVFWPAEEFSPGGPPMGGPRVTDRAHHLPAAWSDATCVPHLGGPMLPPSQPIMMQRPNAYDMIHMHSQNPARILPQEAPPQSLPTHPYFDSTGVRPPEEVVTMPHTVNYANARGPSPRQGPSAPPPGASGFRNSDHGRPAMLMQAPRMSAGGAVPPPKRVAPPPPIPTQSRFAHAEVSATQQHNQGVTEKPQASSSSVPVVVPPHPQQPPPPSSVKRDQTTTNPKPSYASVVGADKRPRSSSGGHGPTGEIIAFVPTSSEQTGGSRGIHSNRGKGRGGARSQVRRQQGNGGRLWMKQSSQVEASAAATEAGGAENCRKIGHSDSCSTDDFSEFAKGRKRS
eukprot:Gregarina_sp_Poly_1__789@NODE_118_length_13642_cov_140_527956_g105_i0_p1_GENE_NODE_118_length_13642_cov_140_527956_g105_i0NODE_118_length_13642_cov_140_527956_g105_i0_p1_ORF_typecomplete_len874_score108_14RRM_1/PF00076_22/0_00064_NODE_118_length_13642_cov_140_527956_g105_i042456866